MAIERREIEARKKLAAEHLGRGGVRAVWIGFKEKGGAVTDQVSVVVGVEKKLPRDQVAAEDLVPAEVGGVPTDVVETGEIRALSLTARRRPCPGGYSVGHYRITAGTLGAWVRRDASDRLHILSNNHVLADSNKGRVNDPILQPGPYDGGRDPADRIALLEEYVRINFSGGDKKKKWLGLPFWMLAKAAVNGLAAVFNGLAAAVGCPYRIGRYTVGKPFEVSQPDPNLVDAALALPLNDADADPRIEFLGALAGIRDLQLGDAVRKVGRTTELKNGTVVGIEGAVQVSYGPDGIAVFDDQLIIGPAGFSAGGDSGSAILDGQNFLGGLLFAGSDTITIANRISNVVALLGARL